MTTLIRWVFALLIVAAPADAAVHWEDTFEDPALPGWALFNNLPMVYPPFGVMTDRAFHGTKSLKLLYVGEPGGGPWIDRNFPATDDLWFRVVANERGFVNGTVSTKFMRFSGLTGSPDFWWLYLYGDRTPAFSVQVDGSICPGTGFGPYDSCNYFATLASTPQPMDQWVCYEGHFKMNTPGVANGVLEQWATNMTTGGPRIQTHGLYTRTWRGPSGANPPGCVGGGCNSSQATFSYVRLYRQNGTGERWIDDLAVGNTPIGCAGAAPLAPGTPTGTTVTKLMQQIWQWLAPAAAWAR